MKEKMWSMLVHLSRNQWKNNVGKPFAEGFDETFWDYILQEAPKAGLNAIVLDVGDAIQYASHPEISQKGCWTRSRVRSEVIRCRELGLELIPKLNFATVHSFWQGEYRKMTSSTPYYKMASDLIHEVAELFDHPSYIHLGMDEESAFFARMHEYAIFRQGEQYWYDLRYLVDCVYDAGSKPWVWHNPLFEKYEEYKKRFAKDEVVLSPYYYHAVRKEHWTPITEKEIWVEWYKKPDYAGMNIQYVEEDPICANFFEHALPRANEGYLFMPCASTCHNCECNTYELVEYFKNGAPDESILGYQTAPWGRATWEFKKRYDDSFRLIKEAKEAFYK